MAILGYKIVSIISIGHKMKCIKVGEILLFPGNGIRNHT